MYKRQANVNEAFYKKYDSYKEVVVEDNKNYDVFEKMCIRDRLNARCEQIKSQVSEVKAQVKSTTSL